MSHNTQLKSIQARTSLEETQHIKIKANQKAAAGLGALVSSFKEIRKHTGE